MGFAWRQFQMGFLQPARVGRMRLERYTISERTHHDLEARYTGLGEFVRLLETEPDGKELVWMTDTRAEILEHYPFFKNVTNGSRVLITGLGLGMAVRGAVELGANLVHVVERDPDVAGLTGPQLADWVKQSHSDVEFAVFVDDAYSFTPPHDVTYDAAWHDIWPTIDDRNVAEMNQLRKRYASWVHGPQECWAEPECVQMGTVLYKLKNQLPLTDVELEYAQRTAQSYRLGQAKKALKAAGLG